MKESYYDQYISELNKLYEINPQKAVDTLADSVKRVNNNQPLMKRLGLDDKKLDNFFAILCALLTIPAVFICNTEAGVLFGLVFYLAGLMIGIFVPYAGLIFLCSHGGIGFVFICQDVFEIIKTNPAMSDLSHSARNHLYSIIFVYAAAILLTILHSVVPKVREVKYIKAIISFLYLAGLVLIRLVPYKLGVSPLFPLFD
jgi:hypothetical protein